jgi:murein DD-endopeptidase MepM/ murein hydrolase activator NlpD
VARVGTAVDSNLGALLAARTALDTAEATLSGAEAELAAAVSTREIARGIAEHVQTLADADREQADIATRAYLAASQGDGAAMTSMQAVFGAGNDLLAGLAGVQRVTQITGDAEKLQAIAAQRSEEAAASEAQAQAAWDAVDAVPVDALEAAVAEAESAVAAARAALSSVQSNVASTSVALIDSLPRDAGQLSQQGWASPVTGRKSDGYGPRPNKPIAGVNEFHRGTDIAAGCGTPLFAATGGTVLEARPNGSYGNWVLIDHGAGVSTGYAHLAVGGVLVSAGQLVSPGQLIGTVGSTGASTGCHLHFEVRLGGVAIDAEPFMAARGIRLG